MTGADSDKASRRLWSRVRLGALIPYVVAAVALIAAIVVLGREIHQHIDAIETWIERIGPWGPVAFIGVFVVLTSLLVPDTVMSIIAGALFGVGGGTVAVVAGALVASALQYALSRRLLRNRINRVLAAKPSLLEIQRAVRRQEFRLQVLLRLTPLSPTITSYLLGAAGVRFMGFLAAALALTPGLFLEVYFGHVGKHLAGMAGRDDRSVVGHDVVVIGGLLVCIVVMFLISRMASKVVQQAVAEVGADGPVDGGFK